MSIPSILKLFKSQFIYFDVSIEYDSTDKFIHMNPDNFFRFLKNKSLKMCGFNKVKQINYVTIHSELSC